MSFISFCFLPLWPSNSLYLSSFYNWIKLGRQWMALILVSKEVTWKFSRFIWCRMFALTDWPGVILAARETFEKPSNMPSYFSDGDWCWWVRGKHVRDVMGRRVPRSTVIFLWPVTWHVFSHPSNLGRSAKVWREV